MKKTLKAERSITLSEIMLDGNHKAEADGFC